MKIQNYGDWQGDKPGGHHPPACTCYRCNEERRQLEAAKEEERRVAEYDRRMAESQAQGRSQRARVRNFNDRNLSTPQPPRRPPRTSSKAGHRGPRPRRGRSRLAILLWVAFLVVVIGTVAGALYANSSGLLTLPQDDKPALLAAPAETLASEPPPIQDPTTGLTGAVLRPRLFPSAATPASASSPVATPRPTATPRSTLAPGPAPTLGSSREKELA